MSNPLINAYMSLVIPLVDTGNMLTLAKAKLEQLKPDDPEKEKLTKYVTFLQEKYDEMKALYDDKEEGR